MIAGTLRSHHGNVDAQQAWTGQLVTGALSPGAKPGGVNGQDAYNDMLIPTAFDGNNTSGPIEIAAAVKAPGGAGRMDFESETLAVAGATGVRRLMPIECERLQGFPAGYTAVVYRRKPAKDGPRYKAIGNSMAVPVVRWILHRVGIVDQIPEGR